MMKKGYISFRRRRFYLKSHILNGMNSHNHPEIQFNSLTTSDEKAEFANSVDLDEVAHHEPPHLDLHCLPSSL